MRSGSTGAVIVRGVVEIGRRARVGRADGGFHPPYDCWQYL